MELRTISATSLEVFTKCQARWKAEKLDRVPEIRDRGPAELGTSVHNALEEYVRVVYIEKARVPDLDWLLELYFEYFKAEFGTADKTNEWFDQGEEMLRKWYKRMTPQFPTFEVISVEVKDFLIIKTTHGERKYNYIWDRCDTWVENGKRIIRIVDYKTWRKNLTTTQMRQKIQVRMYAMAAAAQFKDMQPDEIWVQLDQLRHAEVEIDFNRDENLSTWKFVKDQANLILATDENTVKPTLNDECNFCGIKTTCDALRANISGGGTYSLETKEDLLKARYELASQMKGAEYAVKEIDNIIRARAEAEDDDAWTAGEFDLTFGRKTTRVPKKDEIALIVGPQVFKQIGTVTVGAVEKLIKSGELGPEKTSQLKQAFTRTTRNELKVTRNTPEEVQSSVTSQKLTPLSAV